METQDILYLALAIALGNLLHEYISVGIFYAHKAWKDRHDKVIRWKDIPPDAQGEHAEVHYDPPHRRPLLWLLAALVVITLALGWYVIRVQWALGLYN